MAASRICFVAIATVWLPSPAPALERQLPGVPKECSGLRGTELDKCVRDHTPPTMVQNVKPIRQQPQPGATVNCERVLPADKAFCVWRNQAIVDCRRAASKQQGLKQCFNAAMERVPKPGLADCSRAKSKQLAALCASRNKHYKTCGADPLNYFTCLNQQQAKK